MNDENDEYSIEKLISNRTSFSNFVSAIITDEIENTIYNFVRNINLNTDDCASIFGGRNWSNLLTPHIDNISDIREQASFLKGNFDILIITNDPFNETTNSEKTTKTTKTTKATKIIKEKNYNVMQKNIYEICNFICD